LRNEHHRSIVAELQRSALPPKLPRQKAPIIEVAYSARGDFMTVRGDWHDVFELSAGRLTITVGDVCGADRQQR
jgi:serine phosphatase RsbU (regulator of sigma subunit)